MHVLFAVDDTNRAFEALERTLSRVRETGDELTVALLETRTTDPEALERRVEATLERCGTTATIQRIEGDAGGGLVELADTEGFDSLVIDGSERTPTGKIRLDSTTEFVLLNAKTSVTLAR